MSPIVPIIHQPLKINHQDENFTSVMYCIKPLILIDSPDTLNQTLMIIESYSETSFKKENLIKIRKIYKDVTALKASLSCRKQVDQNRSNLINDCILLIDKSFN